MPGLRSDPWSASSAGSLFCPLKSFHGEINAAPTERLRKTVVCYQVGLQASLKLAGGQLAVCEFRSGFPYGRGSFRAGATPLLRLFCRTIRLDWLNVVRKASRTGKFLEISLNYRKFAVYAAPMNG